MVRVIPLVLLFIVILVLILVLFRNSKKKERFVDTPSKQTPGERGLVFGYVPKDMGTAVPNNTNTTNTSNLITNGDSIQIYCKDKYLGYSIKNALFPNFLTRLGTFIPYSYENIKIHVKDTNTKILYNTTHIFFTIKHLNDSYYLNFVPSTNTFYLSTNTPSYFTFVNINSPSSNVEVRYDDNILIKLLDNSEFLFVYDELLITEKDKSSTFNIKKGEMVDICANLTSKTNTDFMPKEMTKEQVSQLERQYMKDIDDYVANLKGAKSAEINSIKERIKTLEGQLEIAKGNSKMKLEVEKLKQQNEMKNKETEMRAEISKFKANKDIEFTKAKDKIVNEKKEQWTKEITELRESIEKKCAANAASGATNVATGAAIGTNVATGAAIGTNVANKQPIVATKQPILATKQPIVAPKQPIVAPKKPVVVAKKPVVPSKRR